VLAAVKKKREEAASFSAVSPAPAAFACYRATLVYLVSFSPIKCSHVCVPKKVLKSASRWKTAFSITAKNRKRIVTRKIDSNVKRLGAVELQSKIQNGAAASSLSFTVIIVSVFICLLLCVEEKESFCVCLCYEYCLPLFLLLIPIKDMREKKKKLSPCYEVLPSVVRSRQHHSDLLLMALLLSFFFVCVRVSLLVLFFLSFFSFCFAVLPRQKTSEKTATGVLFLVYLLVRGLFACCLKQKRRKKKREIK
jgi:hypothetical protein